MSDSDHGVCDRHLAHEVLEILDVFAVEDDLELGFVVARGLLDDVDLLLKSRIADLDVEHKAVKLRLRQRISSFLLDRVLGRQARRNGSSSL
jgi:hypothetical protein